MMGKLMKSRV